MNISISLHATRDSGGGLTADSTWFKGAGKAQPAGYVALEFGVGNDRVCLFADNDGDLFEILEAVSKARKQLADHDPDAARKAAEEYVICGVERHDDGEWTVGDLVSDSPFTAIGYVDPAKL